MKYPSLGRLVPGSPIPAKAINEFAAAIEARSRRGSGGLPEQLGSSRGPSNGKFHARLSGARNPYAFEEVAGIPGGGWRPASHPRTGLAWEANDREGLGDKVVLIRPGGEGEWRFDWVARRRSSSPVTLGGCHCSSTPFTVNLEVPDPTLNSGVFKPCVIEYQAVPVELAPLALGDFAFLSTTLQVSDYEPYEYYWLLTCFENAYTISRIFLYLPVAGGLYREPGIVSWFAEAEPGRNVCSPWRYDLVTASFGLSPQDLILSDGT